MANLSGYSWRYWRFTDCNGKSMILDFNNDSTWLTSDIVNRTNDGERLLSLFDDGTLTNGALIKLPKSGKCYSVYCVDKSEIAIIETKQRYGEYLSSCTFWHEPSYPFSEFTLIEAYDQLPNDSVIVCESINIARYDNCECINPNQYNSIEIIDLCNNNRVRFVKVDAFNNIIGFEFDNIYYITCFDTPSVYQVIGYSMHEVDVDYPTVFPQCVYDFNEEGVEDMCGDKYHFKGCDGDDIYSVYVNTELTLEPDKYYKINTGDGDKCYKYIGKEAGVFTHESVRINEGGFIDCDCMMSWNGKFESCKGETTIVVSVQTMFREQIEENTYYTIGDMAVVNINGRYTKNCFKFIGYTNDDVDCEIFMTQLKECDNSDCSLMFIPSKVISCFDNYEENVWVELELANYLASNNFSTFTYNGHNCCYFEYDFEHAIDDKPVDATIITIHNISNPTTDCEKCRSELLENGHATCLVIHPCNEDDCDYYLEMNDNYTIYDGSYISFMFMGEEICGKVEIDCSSLETGLNEARMIQTSDITGCYINCDECNNSIHPEEHEEEIKTGREVEPNYEVSDSFGCVKYNNCCCEK